MFTAFFAVIFSLYAVLCLLCPVANSLYAVLFSLCTELKSLYAVLSSCRAFPSLYAVLFLLCAVANSLYAVLFSLYSRDLVLARFETRPPTQGSKNGYRDQEVFISGPTNVSTLNTDHQQPYIEIMAHFVPYGYQGV